MIEILNELGLTPNEAKIYLALIRYGSMGLKDLTKTTGLYRANTYEALDKLSKKSLVSTSFSGKRKTYNAVSPERLKWLLDEKAKRLDSVLPELMEMIKGKQRPTIDILYGKEGIKTMLDDELEVGETLYVMQSSQTIDSKAGTYLEISRHRRVAQNMVMKILYGKDDSLWAKKAAKHKLTEVRVVNDNFSISIEMYGDRTVITFGEEPTLIRIIDKETVKRFLMFFEMNWKKGKQL
ncbi:MAG: helix-turn-helix domain-containing protein [Candidatus Micrarchaeota archaeon]|nr:helix-turn-helix domain-containing protein [Candidatus Micrarchaeota archaeon]